MKHQIDRSRPIHDQARRVHRHYYAPMTTGMGLISFEDAHQ